MLKVSCEEKGNNLLKKAVGKKIFFPSLVEPHVNMFCPFRFFLCFPDENRNQLDLFILLLDLNKGNLNYLRVFLSERLTLKPEEGLLRVELQSDSSGSRQREY